MTGTKSKAGEKTTGFSLALPKKANISEDPLRLQLNIHQEIITMTEFEDDMQSTRVVSAMDLAKALSSELNYSSGIMPEGALWRTTNSAGVFTAYFVKSGIRKLALQTGVVKIDRYDIPLPGLIFICQPAKAPAVFAVKRRPEPGSEADVVYHAPLCNIFNSGTSCGGYNTYPPKTEDIPESFLTSFFTASADLSNRSVKFNNNVVNLWKYLHKKRRFPLNDLVPFGLIQDLLNWRS